MGTIYSTPQAAKILHVSEATIRNYVMMDLYAPYLTPGANPPKGRQRALTREDLAILAFIRERTAVGDMHDQIVDQLEEKIAASELPPLPMHEEEPPSTPEPDGWGIPKEPPATGSTANRAPLAIMAQTLTAELAAAREREHQAREREQQLWDRLIAAETARAHAEGELAALREARGTERRPWWKRLTGG